MRTAVWATGQRLLEHAEGAGADRQDVAAFMDHLNPESRYWARMGQHFRRLMVELPGDRDHRDARLAEWTDTVTETARSAFRTIEAGLGASPRVLKALHGRGGGWAALNAGLKELNPEPLKEVAHE